MSSVKKTNQTLKIYLIALIFGFMFVIIAFVNLYSISLFIIGSEASNSIFEILNVHTFENIDNASQIEQIILSAKVSLAIGIVITVFSFYLIINKQNNEFLKIVLILSLFSIPVFLILGGL